MYACSKYSVLKESPEKVTATMSNMHSRLLESLPCPQVARSGLGDPSLLLRIDIVLRRSLNAVAAGLHLYKMYSSGVCGDNVNLQMTMSPVPFDNNMPALLKEAARDVFALLS